MALEVHLARIQLLGSVPTTREITTGFRPKAGIMWGGKLPTQANNYTNRNTHPYLGFWDDAFNNAGISCQNVNAVATSETRKVLSKTFCVTIFDNSGDSFAVQGKVDAVSDTSFDFTTDVENSGSMRVLMLTFGGDDITGTMVGTFNEPSSTGLLNVAGDADVQGIADDHGLVMFIGAQHPSSKFDTTENSNSFSYGMAVSASKQGSMFFGAANGAETQTCFQAFNSTHCLISNATNSITVRHKAEFSQWLDDGTNFVELDFDVLNFSNQDAIMFLVIKGGDWDMGQETVPASTGEKTTITNTIPKALLTVGMDVTASQDNIAEDISYHMGVALTAANEFSFGIQIEQGVETMQNSPKSSSNDTHAVLTAGATLSAEGNTKEFTANKKFVIDWTTADGTESIFDWFVAGDSTQVFAVGGGREGRTTQKGVSILEQDRSLKPLGERPKLKRQEMAVAKLAIRSQTRSISSMLITEKIRNISNITPRQVAGLVISKLVYKIEHRAKIKIKFFEKNVSYSMLHNGMLNHFLTTRKLDVITEQINALVKLTQTRTEAEISALKINKLKTLAEFGNIIKDLQSAPGRIKIFEFNEEIKDEALRAFTHSSSFVGNVTYDQDNQGMTILLNGKEYSFCGVPERIFDAFEGADSKGAYFARNIKEQFNC